MTGLPPLKVICTLTVASLASLIVISSQATPPSLRVDEVAHADPGSSVLVRGIAVSVRIWDDGEARLLLADHLSGSTLTVWVGPSPSGSGASQIHIGDLVLVEGRVSTGSDVLTVRATASSIAVLSTSERALTVDYLCDNWRLFEHDRLNISGVLGRDLVSGDLRLLNAHGDRGIPVNCGQLSYSELYNKLVTVDGTLYVDVDAMAILLKAWKITASSG